MEKFTSRRDREPKQQTKLEKKLEVKHTPWYKKRSVIITAVTVVVCLVILMISMVLLAVSSNSRAEKIDQAQELSRSHLATLETESSELSHQERALKLEEWAEDLDELKCSSRAKLPWLADSNQRCDDYNKTRAELQDKINQMNNIMRYDMALEESLAQVKETNTVDDVTAELAKWQEVAQQVEALPHADGMGEVHARLIERVQTVRTAWEQLKVAHEEKDSELFRELEASLPEKYGNLQMIREELARLYDTKQAELLEAVKVHHS